VNKLDSSPAPLHVNHVRNAEINGNQNIAVYGLALARDNECSSTPLCVHHIRNAESNGNVGVYIVMVGIDATVIASVDAIEIASVRY
jgi:hypothetical protein